MLDVKTKSAHSRSASSSDVTLRSTTRRLYRDGNIAATVSRPSGGKAALMPSRSRA